MLINVIPNLYNILILNPWNISLNPLGPCSESSLLTEIVSLPHAALPQIRHVAWQLFGLFYYSFP